MVARHSAIRSKLPHYNPSTRSSAVWFVSQRMLLLRGVLAERDQVYHSKVLRPPKDKVVVWNGFVVLTPKLPSLFSRVARVM